MRRRTGLDTFRENLRLQQVYNTLVRYGMDMLLDRGLMGDFRRFMQTWMYKPQSPLIPLTIPVKTRLMIEELGPIYVKMGQIISSQAAVLPDEWAQELVKLQNDVPPVSYEEIEAVIVSELGQSPDKLFASFDTIPLAAASLAQVHRATLPSGEQVVVKIQRPHIESQVRADLGIMYNGVRVLERRSAWARDNNLSGVLNEFSKNILVELDYGSEAYNCNRLSQNMAEIPKVHFPTIYTDYTTARVLTMEFLQGVKANNAAELDKADLDKGEIAETILRAMIKQLLVDGFFHADPHPGNILIDTETNIVNFLDTGMVGEMDFIKRVNMINLMTTLHQRDTMGLAQVIRSLSTPYRKFDEKEYYRDFKRRVGRLLEFDVTTRFSDNVNLMFSVLQDHGLRLDSELTLALKAMMQAETIGRTLFPGRGVIEVGNQIIRELVLDQVTAENMTDMVKAEAAYLGRELVQRLPELREGILKWLLQYEQGKLDVHLDTRELNQELHSIQGSFKEIIIGIMLVGMIIGSAIAASVAEIVGAFSDFIKNVAFFGYTLSMFIAALFVISLIWRLRHRTQNEDL